MSKIIFLILFPILSFAFTDPKVGGTILLKNKSLNHENKNAIIIVDVYKAKTDILLAKLKIKNPIFPQAFVVTPKYISRPELLLEGMVRVQTTYFPDGENTPKKVTGLDKSNLEFEVGKKDLQIELDQESK